MRKKFNINTVLGLFSLVLALVFNHYTLYVLFDGYSYPLLQNSMLILAVVDLILVYTGVAFIINRKNKSYLAKYTKIVAVNVAVMLVMITIIELVFGNWINPNNLNQLNIIRDTQVHYSLDGLYSFESDVVVYTRDRWGLRGEYPDVDCIDILTVGGSTTDQRYIPDSLTWQNILHNEFEANGKEVWVVNAGIDGQSTRGHIKNFDWWFPGIPNLSVKYYLFYVGVNDYYKGAGHVDDELLAAPVQSELENIAGVIASRSALYYLNRVVNGIILARVYGLAHNTAHHAYREFSTENWIDQPLASNYEAIMKNRLDAYEQRLNVLCERVASVGSIPIFVTQSSGRVYDFVDGQLLAAPDISQYEGHRTNGVDYYYMSRLLNGATQKVCQENGGIFINLDAELDFNIHDDFYDRCHNSPSGTDRIGKYLYTKLEYLF
ncbi:MAG: hypothetical protein KAR40_04365 [Candidatus Sabulitectum sp.]|nr:hypothetical protein [Candidatus Sabulitectum sp.]